MNLSYIAGIFATLLGVLYTVQAFLIRNASIGNPMAPKIFPLSLGILMIIFGLGLAITEGKKSTFKLNVKEINFTPSGKLIAYTCIAILLYALSFNRLGYVISTIIFLEIVLSLFNGLKKWKLNTVISVVFSLTIYVVFSRFLGVMLPPMPFLGL